MTFTTTDIPKRQGALKSGTFMNMLFKGMDNEFSKLLKELQPWITQNQTSQTDWGAPSTKQWQLPPSVRVGDPATLPRYLVVPQVADYACHYREFVQVPPRNTEGLTIALREEDVVAFSSWPLNAFESGLFNILLTLNTMNTHTLLSCHCALDSLQKSCLRCRGSSKGWLQCHLRCHSICSSTHRATLQRPCYKDSTLMLPLMPSKRVS